MRVKKRKLRPECFSKVFGNISKGGALPPLIRGHEALVIYAWGKSRFKPGWVRSKAMFKGDYLVISRPEKTVTAEYKLGSKGKIEHRLEKRRPYLHVTTATMTKVPLD